MDDGDADDTVRLRRPASTQQLPPPLAAKPQPQRGRLVILGIALAIASGMTMLLVGHDDRQAAGGSPAPQASVAGAQATAPDNGDGEAGSGGASRPTLAHTGTAQTEGLAQHRREPYQQVALAPFPVPSGTAPGTPDDTRGVAVAPPATLAPAAGPETQDSNPSRVSESAVPHPPIVPSASPPLASEADLVGMSVDQPVMLRLRDNAAVFVLLFPTLDAQGTALNRIAALVEKAGLPRHRLLNDEELAAAIQRSGENAATWYLGHDYQGTDLARFFALAERDGIALNPAEIWVRDRFVEARALVPEGSEVAMISTANPDHRFDTAMRAAILRHEIAHGHFFTRPDVRAHVLKVWRERFRDRDRQAIRGFLGREGYDTTNDLLMANEAMAYLLFTPDPRFFSARLAGVSDAELARMRALMRDGLPLP